MTAPIDSDRRIVAHPNFRGVRLMLTPLSVTGPNRPGGSKILGLSAGSLASIHPVSPRCIARLGGSLATRYINVVEWTGSEPSGQARRGRARRRPGSAPVQNKPKCPLASRHVQRRPAESDRRKWQNEPTVAASVGGADGYAKRPDLHPNARCVRGGRTNPTWSFDRFASSPDHRQHP
jgi:hypothetical protein